MLYFSPARVVTRDPNWLLHLLHLLKLYFNSIKDGERLLSETLALSILPALKEAGDNFVSSAPGIKAWHCISC